MGFKNKKNWLNKKDKLKNKVNKLTSKAGNLLNKTKPTLIRVVDFVKNNKGFVVLTVTTVVGSVGASSYISVMLPEFAKTLSDSTLTVIAGKEFRKAEVLSLLKKLRELEVFTVCDFEPLVLDLDLSDVKRVQKLNTFLVSIENIGNIDLKNHHIICIVTTLASLYFSNCSNFNSIIEGLLNALKRGYLSRRLFELIMAMLRRRGVPIHEILAMLDGYE